MAKHKVTIEQKALLLLRLSLGGFLLLWGIDKLVSPETTVKIFGMFYMIPIDLGIAYAVGIAEVLLALAIMIGLYKKWTYGLGMILHGISTISTYKQLAMPFGKNHLFIAALPVLAAFIVLYLLRDKDTYLTVSA